jgi:hypothetical protein
LDELSEPLNSDSTHCQLIERGAEVPQTPFINTAHERQPEKEEIMKRKLMYAFAASIFALTLVGTPTKAHAAAEIFLTVDGGGGESGGSHSSGVGGSTLTGWFVQLLDSIGIR